MMLEIISIFVSLLILIAYFLNNKFVKLNNDVDALKHEIIEEMEDMSNDVRFEINILRRDFKKLMDDVYMKSYMYNIYITIVYIVSIILITLQRSYL